VRIRLLRDVHGGFHLGAGPDGKGYYDPKAGDVVEIDDDHARRYVESKLAVAADDGAHF
jgi:hypothetical protein